jgi:MoxR-like ATPase
MPARASSSETTTPTDQKVRAEMADRGDAPAPSASSTVPPAIDTGADAGQSSRANPVTAETYERPATKPQESTSNQSPGNSGEVIESLESSGTAPEVEQPIGNGPASKSEDGMNDSPVEDVATTHSEISNAPEADAPAGSTANGSVGVEQIADLALRVREAVQQVIVGKDESINLAIVALLCRGHLLIEDVPGLGKTTLAKALAASLRCDFGRIQFTPDLMPADVLGVSIFNMRDNEFEFRKGPIFTQVLLADEINRATPRTQTALLEAMQERQVTMDGVTRPLPDPFLVIATLNPVELEGTFPLPEAQLDRFMLRISLGYPSREEESDIIERFTAGGRAPETPAVVTREELLAAQNSIADVTVEPSLLDYLLSLVAATREHEALHLGASPRAAIALYNAAQAWAAIQGRGYVLPDDIKHVAVSVLAHRVMVSPQVGLRGRSGDNIIRELLEMTEVPIER